MATVINNPSDNSGSGALLAAVFLLLVVLALLYFGLPYVRGTANSGAQTTPTIQNTIQQPDTPDTTETQGSSPQSPAEGDNGGTSINIPDRIDVNLNGQSQAPAASQAPSGEQQ